MTAGADFILSALVQEGLTHLFMAPGGLVDPFLPALARQRKLQPIVACPAERTIVIFARA